MISDAEQPLAQRRVRGGVDGRPGERQCAVAHRGVGRGGDAGGCELVLVVHGATGLDADEGMDGGDRQRHVGHVGRECGERHVGIVGFEGAAE